MLMSAKEYEGTHWTAVRDAEELDWFSKGLTATDMTALADIVKGGLPRLEVLSVYSNPLIGSEGVQARFQMDPLVVGQTASHSLWRSV